MTNTTLPTAGSARSVPSDASGLRLPLTGDRCLLYAFSVTRRSTKAAMGTAVAPRRVCVYAPSPEAAQEGAGVSKDELVRRVPVRAWERLQVWGQPAREDVADFYETLGSALITGAGMTVALNMAARVARSVRLRGVIGALQCRIKHGEELHVAMRAFPQVFTPMQLAMVEAASATGLDKAGGLLMTLAQRLQKEGKVWRKFVGALAYPTSLLFLTFAGALVLEIWALPPMVELFRTLGGRLPPITEAFYSVAQVLRAHAMIVFPLLAAGLVAGLLLWPRLLQTRSAQRLSVRLPIVGPIVQWTALVRALGTFILLNQSGAKVRDQFALSAAAAGNCVVGEFFEACYARIAFGESVEEAFTAERHRLGEDGTRIAGKMEVGMAGADLGQLINRIADELNDRAESRLAVLPNLLRWPLLTICCALIGTVALAIVLPYPNLIADIAQQQTGAGR